MSKRQKFVVAAVLLALGFVGINFLDETYRFLAVGGLTMFTLLAFAWGLWEGLGINATLLTLVLPSLFTLGVGLFWFLLPSLVIARIPVVVMYGLGIYALGLTANIYTVSAIRNIALMRAAKGVGFVLTLLTSFLLFDAIFSVKTDIWVNGILVFGAAFVLFLQGLWTSDLNPVLGKPLLIKSLVFALALAELVIPLFFWPVTVVVGSLFITVGVYVLLGLGQAEIEGRLFTQTIREYLTVGFLVLVAMMIATQWGA